MALRTYAGRAWAASTVVDVVTSLCTATRLQPNYRALIVSDGALSLRSSYFGSTPKLLFPARIPKRKSVTKTWGPVARIKRRKDPSFDNVIQREKKLKIVSRIKDLVVKQPGLVMSLRDLGKHRKQIGLTGKRRCVALLNKFPAVFRVFEEGCNVYYFRLTDEAENHYKEELKLRNELEVAAVEKLRKLLMMSIDKRILVGKIAHLKRDLGLSDDYLATVVPKYPQYLRLVETEGGLALELMEWDPELAVSAWEKKKAREEAAKQLAPPERESKFRKIDLPKGYNLSRKDREVILKFQDMPYFSPYGDASQLDPSSLEAEKHAVYVVHEVLSLTLEKRLIIDHLTHFRRDYKFSQRVYAMLIRHPELFYVSLKGARDCVFLREAYNGSELIDKDPLFLLKERLADMVALGKKGAQSSDEEEGSEGEDEGDDFDDLSDDEGEESAETDDDDMDVIQAELEVTNAEIQGSRDVRDTTRKLFETPRVRDRW